MQTSRCPACNSDVIIEDGAYEGDLVSCINCGAELEITSLHPPRLSALAEEEEEMPADPDESVEPEA